MYWLSTNSCSSEIVYLLFKISNSNCFTPRNRRFLVYWALYISALGRCCLLSTQVCDELYSVNSNWHAELVFTVQGPKGVYLILVRTHSPQSRPHWSAFHASPARRPCPPSLTHSWTHFDFSSSIDYIAKLFSSFSTISGRCIVYYTAGAWPVWPVSDLYWPKYNSVLVWPNLWAHPLSLLFPSPHSDAVAEDGDWGVQS